MGQQAGKEAGVQAAKAAAKAAAQGPKFAVDPKGPGGTVLRAFDQHLKNKQKWGVAAEDYDRILARVAKHGQADQPTPGAIGTQPVEGTGASSSSSTAADLLKRKLKAREPQANLQYAPRAAPNAPSAEYVRMQELMKAKLGMASGGPSPAAGPGPESPGPSTPIRKVSRIPPKQSSVLMSSTELAQGGGKLQQKATAVDPQTQQGLRAVGMFKRKAKTVMGQKQTNITLERVGDVAAMSDAAWYTMLWSRRNSAASMAEVEEKSKPVPPEVVRDVCKYFDAHEVQFFRALHSQAVQDHLSYAAVLPGHRMVSRGGFHAFPAPPVPLDG